MLLIAVAASIACLVWIALDAGTEEVFIVYGRLLRTAWRLKAWSAFATCGWRLAIIVAVIFGNVWLACQAMASMGADFDALSIVSWCIAVLLALGLVPWTFAMRAVHQRRLARANAVLMTEVATRLCTLPDLSSELESAGYATEPGWDAWHPNAEWFQSPEGQRLWRRIVPVIYTSTEFPRTVVVPVDWSSFCVWGHPPTFAHSGELLPFGGPGTSRFRAGTSVRRLESAGNCWIVAAELVIPEEVEECSQTSECT